MTFVRDAQRLLRPLCRRDDAVLRAAGIPARVVAGYQGGEFNPAGNYVQVRQFDAHAWVEYWQAGRGWVSVDPTFQVAPERIDLGLEEALAGEQSFSRTRPFRHCAIATSVG